MGRILYKTCGSHANEGAKQSEYVENESNKLERKDEKFLVPIIIPTVTNVRRPNMIFIEAAMD